jgi:hypothetical protein
MSSFPGLVLTGLLSCVALGAVPALAAPITYVNLDGTSFGSGFPFSGFGSASVISPSNLDGSAFLFGVDDQMEWDRAPASESSTHHVAFDYFAAPSAGANITFFLDVPTILRFDFTATGRHHVDLFFDFPTQTIQSFVDGTLDNSVLSTAAWPTTPVSRDIRILNQSTGPGNSHGPFEIDNLLWQGNVALVPEPSTIALLLALSPALLALRRRGKA